MSLSWFLECTAVMMLQIVTVFGRASTRLRYSQSPGRRVPNRSSTGACIKVAILKIILCCRGILCRRDHATHERCDRIFLHQWWILPPYSVHSANVAWGPHWHHLIDCCNSQADLPRTPVPTSWLHQSSKWVFDGTQLPQLEKNMNCKLLPRDPAWSIGQLTVKMNSEIGHRGWKMNVSRQQLELLQCRLWPAAVAIQSISLVSSLRSSWVCCSSSMIQFFSVQLTNRRTAVRASEAPVLRGTCVSSAYEWAFMSSHLMIYPAILPCTEGIEEVQARNLVGHRRSTSWRRTAVLGMSLAASGPRGRILSN